MHEQLKARGLVIEHPNACTLRITGADRLTWLNGLVTTEVSGASRGATRGLCLDRLGKILAEVIVWCRPLHVDLVVLGGDCRQLVDHLQRHLVMEDVEISLVSDRLYSMSGDSASDAEGLLGTFSRQPTEPVIWLTPKDAVTLLPSSEESEFRQRVTREGSAIAGAERWNELRAGAGVPAFGRDYGPDDTPATAGLVDELVSRTKGCYLGQEVVCKTLMRGAIREQVVRLWFDGFPPVGADIFAAGAGDLVGRISTVAAAGDHARVWAMGRVRCSAIAADAAVTSQGISGRICPR